MISITKEQLQALCGDETRPTIRKPFSVNIDGQWWNGATNGHGLLLVRGDIGEFRLGQFKRDDAPPIDKILRRAKEKPTHVARLSLLAKWCANCEQWNTCKACVGSGNHDSPCPECKGTKGAWNQMQVDHECWSFDRVLAGRFLAPLTETDVDAEVFFGDESDPIEFRRPEWRVVLIPMRRGNIKRTTGSVPDGLIRKHMEAVG